MKRFTAIIVLILLLCFPQNSRAANFYWGGRVFASTVELKGLKLNLNGTRGYPRQTLSMGKNADTTAVGASLFLGLDFNRAGNVPLRLEWETSIRNGDSIQINDTFFTAGSIYTARVEAELDIEAFFSNSINLWLDVPVGSFPVKPYIGGGAGYNFAIYDADITINRGSSGIEASKSRRGRKKAFYYSFGGGARMSIGKRTFLDLSLRYMKEQDMTINMRPLGLQFSTSIFDAGLGLQYYF